VPAIHLPPDPVAAPRYLELIGALEAGGFDGLWIGEVNGIDAASAAALTAFGSRSAAVGALLNTFTRAPTTLAMTASTLAHLAPGRAHVVLGVASPLLVERWNGIPYRRAFDRLRDVLRFMRAALTGQRVTGEFTTIASDGFALPSPPDPPPPLLVAACGPRALELAAREADGVVLNWLAPDDVERIAPLPDDRGRVSIAVQVCPTPDRHTMEAIMRPVLADYLRAPAYADQQRRLGRGPALEAMWQAGDAGDRAGARDAVPSSVLDDLVVWGEPGSCYRRIVEMEKQTGARVIASLFPPPGVDYIDGALGLAGERRP
jgi:probable F420-dependent oxidoreductase